jgi:hypothetical protein
MRLHVTKNNFQVISYRIPVNCNCKNNRLVKNIFKIKIKTAITFSNLTIQSFSLIWINKYTAR